MDNFLGLIGLAMRAGKVRCGAFSAARAAEDGSAKLMVAATDIGADNRRRIEAVCREYGIPLMYHSTSQELSRSVGKRSTPVVCVCDDSFAAAARKYDLTGKDGSPNE